MEERGWGVIEYSGRIRVVSGNLRDENVVYIKSNIREKKS
jgi:hypothetical protein